MQQEVVHNGKYVYVQNYSLSSLWIYKTNANKCPFISPLSSIQLTHNNIRDTIDGTLHCKRQTNNMTTAADGPPTNVADMKILPKKDWLRNPKVSSICVFDIIDDGSK